MHFGVITTANINHAFHHRHGYTTNFRPLTYVNPFLSYQHASNRHGCVHLSRRRNRFCREKGNELIQEEKQQEEPVVIDPRSNGDDEDESTQFFQQLGGSAILSACLVVLFTGVTVVLFNYAVHEIRDFCWD